MAAKMISIGKVLKPRGIKGEIKVLPLTENIEKRFKKGNALLLEGFNKEDYSKYTIKKVSFGSKNTVFLKLNEINSYEEANSLRDQHFVIPESELELLENDRYYFFQIIGLKVIDEDNNEIGKVDEIQQTGSNDVYIIKNKAGEEILLPATKEVVKKVDLQEGIMIVHLLPGLR